MTASKWVPDDGELDAVARSLPRSEASAVHAEQNRTRLLASAAMLAQRSRGARGPVLAGVGISLAAAAALVIYLVGRDGSQAPAKESVAELRPSRFERGTWPSYRLQLHDGRLSVRVGSLAAADRFLIAVGDAEIEARSARFVTEVADERLAEVLVEEGKVELRVIGQQPMFLSAGQQWMATKTAQIEELKPATPAEPEDDPAGSAPRTERSATTRRDGADRARSAAVVAPRPDEAAGGRARTAEPVGSAEAAKPGPVASDQPGEAEFRRGWRALRNGDAATAMAAFARACDATTTSAIGEDACYWSGVAAKRAGQAAVARGSLARFIERFPASARAGEAAALLGWLLYDAGELDGAERQFRHAATDRAPTVRTSAERGLEAIARTRASR